MSGFPPLSAGWPYTDFVVAAPDTGLGMVVGDGLTMPWAGVSGGGVSVCAWRLCGRCESCTRFNAGGVLWRRDLQRLKCDDRAMANLRRIVAQTQADFQLSPLDDDAVIRHFVRLLVGNRLPLCAQFARAQRPTGAPQTPTPKPADPAPPPTRKAAAPAPVMAATPEESSFPPTHDAAAQAATLVEAAKTGEPFCEECERQRKRRAAARGPGD